MSKTGLFCTILVIASTVYDVIALQMGGVNNSISAWFASFSPYPVPVFCMGWLGGHFVARMPLGTPAGALKAPVTRPIADSGIDGLDNGKSNAETILLIEREADEKKKGASM